MLLVAAMRGGAWVLDTDIQMTTATHPGGGATHPWGTGVIHPGGAGVRKVLHQSQHRSMVYGVDWVEVTQPRGVGVQRDMVASCSFYDKSLRIWNGFLG